VNRTSWVVRGRHTYAIHRLSSFWHLNHLEVDGLADGFIVFILPDFAALQRTHYLKLSIKRVHIWLKLCLTNGKAIIWGPFNIILNWMVCCELHTSNSNAAQENSLYLFWDRSSCFLFLWRLVAICTLFYTESIFVVMNTSPFDFLIIWTL
jgi:hypothetical protein